MIQNIFSTIGISALSKLLRSALGTMQHPVAKGASDALDRVEREIQWAHITPEELQAAQTHMQHMAEIELKHLSAVSAEVNQSLRTEVQSDDLYIRRMRPTFGYLMALTWTVQMLGVAYILIFRTSEAGVVIEAMESLSLIWGVALSVLGIYVYKRSADKRLGL